MITTAELTQLISHEFKVLKHLYTKLNQENINHKFTENQRSVKELLQYLANSPLLTAKSIITGENHSSEEYKKMLSETNVDDFAALIDREEAEITALMAGLTNEQLQEEVTLRGFITAKRAVHLVQLYAQVTAYKMQLFLQLKHSGLHELVTSNVWMGMDPQK